MKAAFYILFGALFTGATSLALGLVLFRWIKIRLRRVEDYLLAFVTGSALLSGIVFVLSCAHLVHKGVFVVLGILSIAEALHQEVNKPPSEPLPPLARKWFWITLAVVAVFTSLYFFDAMAPETSPDGTAYHLRFPADYYRAHGFLRIPWNIYANISQGIEMLFLFAFAFGRQSAATLIHFTFLMVIPWLMISWGRRFGHTAAATAGALFFFVSPVVGIDGTSAYVDVALACTLFALFYFLQIWDVERNARLLIPIGILTGFSFSIKYTAFLAVPYTLGFIGWKLWKSRLPLAIPLVRIAVIASLFILPWIVKSTLWMANPAAPFANALFPNPYVHISFEQEYRDYQRNYGIDTFKHIPRELTYKGQILTGVFGPLFLLTPLALLALRKPAGRQILLAAAVFALPYPANVGTRFLIPAAPFISIALAMAFANWEWLLLLLVIAHSVASWPDVMTYYCSPYAWRLSGKFRVEPALRIESEDSYLSHTMPGYLYDRMLEKYVPPQSKVFAFNQVTEAYTSRQILVRYLSAPSEVLADIMWTPLFEEFQPVIQSDFRFPAQAVRKIRVVRTKDRPDRRQWNITEFRVFDENGELARDPKWRLKAKPNPWDVQLAFDNSPVTRWRSWEPAKAGMSMEVDFGTVTKVTALQIETGSDWDASLKVEAMDQSGQWRNIDAHLSITNRPIQVGLRRAATAELKARDVRYLLIGADDLGAEDFQQHSDVWGIQFVAEAGGMRLYYIQ